jgi:transposase-like protein
VAQPGSGALAAEYCASNSRSRASKSRISMALANVSTTEEHERIKALERENRELRQANEILRKASAYFVQAELDRRFKP